MCMFTQCFGDVRSRLVGWRTGEFHRPFRRRASSVVGARILNGQKTFKEFKSLNQTKKSNCRDKEKNGGLGCVGSTAQLAFFLCLRGFFSRPSLHKEHKLICIPRTVRDIHSLISSSHVQSQGSISHLGLHHEIHPLLYITPPRQIPLPPKKSKKKETMCRQEYTKCRNVNCNGFAEMLAHTPCENKPNCEIQYVRVRRPRTAEPHCPECRWKDPKERTRASTRAWRKRTGYKSWEGAKRKRAAAAAAAQAAGASTAVGNTHSAVGGQQDPGLVSTSDDFDEAYDSLFDEPTDDDDAADEEGLGGSSFPIDPALLHVDSILSSGPDRAANMRDAERYLRDMGAGSKKASKEKEK